MNKLEFEAEVGFNRLPRRINSLAELLRLVNGGAKLNNVRQVEPLVFNAYIKDEKRPLLAHRYPSSNTEYIVWNWDTCKWDHKFETDINKLRAISVNLKRTQDGTVRPFLSAEKYDDLRDDDKFLYNRSPQ